MISFRVMVPMDWINKVREWFSEENEDSNMIIDCHWSIMDNPSSPNGMLVENKDVPFPIGINIDDGVIHVSIYTNIETYDWDKEQKADVFRKLLIQNDESRFIKLVLANRNDEIVLRVDLDTQYLNKSEFNTALSSLVHGGRWFLSQFGMSGYGIGDMSEEEALEILKLGIQIDLNRGREKSEIIRDLVMAGMNENLAMEVVFDVAANPITSNGKKNVGQGEKEKTDAYIH